MPIVHNVECVEHRTHVLYEMHIVHKHTTNQLNGTVNALNESKQFTMSIFLDTRFENVVPNTMVQSRN